MNRRELFAGGAALAGSMVGLDRASEPATFLPSNFRADASQATSDSDIVLEIEFTREGTDTLRGSETVRYHRHSTGQIEVTALSVSKDPAVTRFAWHLLDRDWRPAECAVTITADGQFGGSGRYRIADSGVEMAGVDGTGQTVAKRFEAIEEVAAIVAHTVSSDVMTGVAAAASSALHQSRTPGIYLTSADPYGRRVPEWVSADAHVRSLGVEPVQTPAGALMADHFLLSLPDGTGQYAPFQDLWCLQGTSIFLAAHARAPTSTRYNLRSITLPSAAAWWQRNPL